MNIELLCVKANIIQMVYKYILVSFRLYNENKFHF